MRQRHGRWPPGHADGGFAAASRGPRRGRLLRGILLVAIRGTAAAEVQDGASPARSATASLLLDGSELLLILPLDEEAEPDEGRWHLHRVGRTLLLRSTEGGQTLVLRRRSP